MSDTKPAVVSPVCDKKGDPTEGKKGGRGDHFLCLRLPATNWYLLVFVCVVLFLTSLQKYKDTLLIRSRNLTVCLRDHYLRKVCLRFD